MEVHFIGTVSIWLPSYMQFICGQLVSAAECSRERAKLTSQKKKKEKEREYILIH